MYESDYYNHVNNAKATYQEDYIDIFSDLIIKYNSFGNIKIKINQTFYSKRSYLSCIFNLKRRIKNNLLGL